MTRGMTHQIEGPNDLAKDLGMNNVLSSGVKNEDEGLYPIQHQYWASVMKKAVEAEAVAN